MRTQPTLIGQFPLKTLRRRSAATLTVACILAALTACGGDEPTPAPTATLPPTETTAPTAPAATPAEPDAAATEEGVNPAPPAAVTEIATLSAVGTTAVFEPLQVDESEDCAIESHLDLAGYPDLEQKIGCPVEEASLNPIGINEFGPGPEFDRFMLWFSDERQIYVLFPDNTWQSYADTWTEDEPTYSCNPFDDGEPDSPPLPRRGFGKLWCAQPELQEILGTVPREERLCQHAVLQRFSTGRLLACFEDATVRYFRLLDNRTWDLVVQ